MMQLRHFGYAHSFIYTYLSHFVLPQRVLDAKGLIYKGKHEGWYSVSDECFYTDGQVTRVTPANGTGEEYYVSAETGSRVEWTSEENYKFRLSAFRESLLEHYSKHPEAIFPEQFHADVIDFLSGPVEDLSVSRPRSRLFWGIPVPNDSEHTIYVWIDAVTVYLSATGYPWTSAKGATTKSVWPPNVQIIGKDILRYGAPSKLLIYGIKLFGVQVPCDLPSRDASSSGAAVVASVINAFSLDRRSAKDVEVGWKCGGPDPGHRRVRHRCGEVLPGAHRGTLQGRRRCVFDTQSGV